MNNEQLIRKYQRTYDKKIKNQIIENNIPLIKNIATRYTNISNMNIDELFSYGCEGLIIAIDRFNPDLKTDFQHFLITYIRRYIIDGIYKTQGLKRDKFSSEYLKLKNQFEQDGEQLRDNITYIDKIIDYMIEKDIISEELRDEKKLKLLENNSTSFEEIQDEYYYDNLEQDDSLNKLVIEELRNEFYLLFTYLSEIHANVIKLFFGFDCNPKKVDEIAKICNISTNKVIKIQTEAIKELRMLATFRDLNENLEYFNDMNNENSKVLRKQKRNQN